MPRPFQPLRLALCVALGLATTFLVAWLLALLTPALVNRDGGVAKSLVNGRDSEIFETRFSSWGGLGFAVMPMTTVHRRSGTSPAEDPPQMHELVPPWAFSAVVTSFDDLDSVAYHADGWWCVEARGFPFPALWSAYNSPLGAGRTKVHGGIFAPATFRRPNRLALSSAVVLPLRPIWPGLLANSAIYAALWWLSLSVPSLRRHVRIRRHHCPMCNYNFRGLASGANCPECGSVPEDAAQRQRRPIPRPRELARALMGWSTAACLALGLLSAAAFAIVSVLYLRTGKNISEYRTTDTFIKDWVLAERLEDWIGSTYTALDVAGVKTPSPLPPAWPAYHAAHEARWSEESEPTGNILMQHVMPRRLTLVEWGWPQRMMWGVSLSDATLPNQRTGLIPVELGSQIRYIPWYPVWPGILVNSVCWSVPWWLIVVGLSRVRRQLRLHRNHCPKCNHNLRGLTLDTNCSECGRSPARHP